jgi:hypothetical protein
LAAFPEFTRISGAQAIAPFIKKALLFTSAKSVASGYEALPSFCNQKLSVLL